MHEAHNDVGAHVTILHPYESDSLALKIIEFLFKLNAPTYFSHRTSSTLSVITIKCQSLQDD